MFAVSESKASEIAVDVLLISPLEISEPSAALYLITVNLTIEQKNEIYASEADILNVALFGMTAKQWRTANPNKEGNILLFDDFQGFQAVAGFKKPVALGGQINFQSIDDVRLVIADENVVHGDSSGLLIAYILPPSGLRRKGENS